AGNRGRARAVSGSSTHAPARPERSGAHPISRPHHQPEREADRAAEIVSHGGSLAGWSFAAVSTAPPASPGSVDVGDALSTPGRPLDPATRRRMAAGFGSDFSGVRVHDDARAAATAASIDAAAFTVGDDVVFGRGRYRPSGPDGARLLAH